jgi:hypothetical protein
MPLIGQPSARETSHFLGVSKQISKIQTEHIREETIVLPQSDVADEEDRK